MGWAIIVVLALAWMVFVAFSCALWYFNLWLFGFGFALRLRYWFGFAVAWFGVSTAVGQFVFARLW